MPYFILIDALLQSDPSAGLTDVTGPGQVEGPQKVFSGGGGGGDTSIEPSPGPSSTFTLYQVLW